MAGARKAPPEDCGGPERFMEQEVKSELALWDKKFRLAEIMTDILPSLMDETANIKATVDQHRPELKEILRELEEEEAKFSRVTINQRLRRYADGDADWRYKEFEPAPTRKRTRTKKTTK